MSFAKAMHPHVDHELSLSRVAMMAGDPERAFHHLERAHVLGQPSPMLHLRTHHAMWLWAFSQRDLKEFVGQTLRMVASVLQVVTRFYPPGNTGGTNVHPLREMPIPEDLQAILDQVPNP